MAQESVDILIQQMRGLVSLPKNNNEHTSVPLSGRIMKKAQQINYFEK
jgi:hypothetical protein